MKVSWGLTTRCPGSHHTMRLTCLQNIQHLRVLSLAREQKRSNHQDRICSKNRQRRVHASPRAAVSIDVSSHESVSSTTGSPRQCPSWSDVLNKQPPQRECSGCRDYGDGAARAQLQSYTTGEPGYMKHTLHVRPGQPHYPLHGVQEGCEFLIATDEAGRLDLRDAYVHDLETDMFARPESSGVMPDGPSMCALGLTCI